MLFGQPLSGSGRRSSYFISPFEKQQLEQSILDKGLSSAVWVGETLDKVDRPFRQLIAEGASWFTGEDHDFKWSELFTWLPLSDTVGLTDPNNIATGRDITGYDDPDTIWDGIVNFGAEVLASPTTYLSGGLAAGAKSALGRGGRALQKMGVLDDALETLGKRHIGIMDDPNLAGKTIDQPGGLLPRATKTRHTVGEALDVMKDRVRRDIGYGTSEGKKAAKDLEAGFKLRIGDEAADPELYQNILNSPIGGIWEMHGPLGMNRTGTTFGNERLAEWIDRSWDTLANLPGINHLRSMLTKKLGGALTRTGQWAAKRGYKALDKAMSDSSLKLAQAEVAFEAIGEFDMDVVAKKYSLQPEEATKRVFDNFLSVRRYLESRPEESLSFSLPSQLETLKPELDNMKEVLSLLREEAISKGIRVPDLQDWYISYFPREFNMIEEGTGSLFGPILKTTFRNQQARREYLKSIPGGTYQLTRMALDPDISGVIYRAQPGRVGMRVGRGPVSETAAAGEALQKYKEGTQLIVGEDGSTVASSNMIRDGVVDKIKEKYPDFVEEIRTGHTVRADLTMSGVEPIEGGFAKYTDEPVRELTESEVDDKLAGLAGWLMRLDKRYADEMIPVFKLNPLEDYSNYVMHINRSISSADAIHNMFAHMARPASEFMNEGEEWMYINDALDNLPGFDQGSGAKIRKFVRELESPENVLAQAEGKRVMKGKMPRTMWKTAWMKKYLGAHPQNRGQALAVPLEIVEDAKRLMESFNPELNDGVKGFFGAMLKLQDAWRAGVTKLWPKFWTRNLLGGQANNYFKGAHDPRFGQIDPRRWTAPLADANNILRGKPLQDLQKIPGFERMSDEEATQELMNLIFAHRIFSSHQIGVVSTAADLDAMDTVLKVKSQDEWGNPLSPITGVFQKALDETRQMGASPMLSMKGVAEQLTPYGLLRGRGGFGPKGARLDGAPTGDKMLVAAFGGQMSNIVEGFNRISPFVAYLRQGFDPAVAARKVFEAQVDYRNLTRIERQWLRNIFPFYSFTRGMVPFVISDFLDHRGGAMSWAVRGIAGAQTADPQMESAPEWIRRSTGLPVAGPILESILGKPAQEGATRFIRGAGVPFEDVISLVGAGGQTFTDNVGDSISAIVGRANPFLKSALELGTGHSFFHQRPLRDLESRYANIFTDRRVQSMPLLDQLLDVVPGVSKMAQLVSRTKDPRKRFEWASSLMGDGEGHSGAGILSGIAGEFLPWAYSDYTTGLSRQYNVMSGLKQRLSGQPYVKFFGERPYISDDILPYPSPDPKEKAAAFQRMYPEQYKLLAAYNQITQEVRK